MAAGLFSVGSKDLLFLVASYMVIELVSWRIILDESEEYLGSQRIESLVTTPYRQWSHQQALMAAKYTKSRPRALVDVHESVYDDLKFWSSSSLKNIEEDAMSRKISLSAHHTSLVLGQSNYVYDTQLVELIMAAVLYSFGLVHPERALPIMQFEGHGRQATNDNIDVSRTVGWFTTIAQVQATSHQLHTLVRQIKDIRANTHNGGLSQFCLRTLSADGDDIRLPFELLFDYTGMFQQLERPDAILREVRDIDVVLHGVDMQLPRFSLFAIEAGVSEGKLNVELIYNRHIRHRPSAILDAEMSGLSQRNRGNILTLLSRDVNLSIITFRRFL